jgi:tRNA (guanine-N7-)-methyltransferase
VDCLYLNFSDPWPKAGHKKRRLTHRLFLERYKTVLKKGGILRFKTDNAGLFDFSLEEFEAMGLPMSNLTRDLHNSPLNEGNIMTEYERAWSEKGYPIHAVTVTFEE